MCNSHRFRLRHSIVAIALRLWLAGTLLYAPLVCLRFCQVVHLTHASQPAEVHWRHELAMRHLPTGQSESLFELGASMQPWLEMLRDIWQVFVDLHASQLVHLDNTLHVTFAQPNNPPAPCTPALDPPHPPPR